MNVSCFYVPTFILLILYTTGGGGGDGIGQVGCSNEYEGKEVVIIVGEAVKAQRRDISK
jgi:hypothetical protein